MPIVGPQFVSPPLPSTAGRLVAKSTPKEITVPFSFDRGGGVAITRDPDTQVRQHVEALLHTIPGERVIKTGFGVSLIDYLFENISPAEQAQMQQRISDGFDRWVPEARLVQLVSAMSPEGSSASDTVIITLNYQRRYDTNPTTSTVSIPIISM